MQIKLHPKQYKVLESPATEILYGGAAGGGKSHLMRILAILLASRIDDLQVYLFRRQSEDLLKNHFNGATGFPSLLAELVNSGYCKITYSPAKIEFKNGAVIYACHCQHEKHKYNYQGAEMHVLLIDELTHFTDSIYRYLRGRLRVPEGKIAQQLKELSEALELPIKLPLALSGSNPGGVGHTWVKSSFIDISNPYNITEMNEDEGGMLRQYIPAKLKDNPSLNEEEYKKQLAGLGNPYLVKAMLHGLWDIVAGGAIDDLWNRDKHVIPAFEIPQAWKIYRSFDWGSAKPYSVGWWTIGNGETITFRDGTKMNTINGDRFRIGELYGWNGKPNEGCKKLAKEVSQDILEYENNMGWKIHSGVADSSIFNTEDGHSIAENMKAKPHSVKWEHANKSPGSRKQGLELLRELLSGAVTRESKGLFICESCLHFIRTVPVLPRAERNPEDIDTDAEDHIYDETRYFLTYKPKSMKVGRVLT